MNQQIINQINRSAGWSILAAALMIVVGFLAIIQPAITGVFTAVFLAWVLIFSGVMHFIFASQTHTRGGSMWWEIFVGVLYIAIGVYMLGHPALAVTALTAAIAAYLVIEAVLEFALAHQFRGMKGTGWLVFHGIISLILAWLIFRAWPVNSAWVVGTLVGISLLFSGVTRLVLAMSVHHVTKALTS
jgi:uncharacterized membrane protein HdeD (DUF308 family)